MFAGSGGRVVAQLLIQILLARLLDPHAFGQYAAVLVVVGIGWLLAEGGLGSALIQKQDLLDRDIEQALGWVLLVGAVVAAALFAAAPLVSAQLGDATLEPLLRMSSLLVFLMALSSIPTSLLRRRLDERRLQIIQFCSYVLAYGGVSIVLAVAGAGAWSLVVGFAAQSAVTLLLSYLAVRHTLRVRLHGDARLRGFGLKVLANNVINWGIESLDRALVGRFWGIHALGLYSVAANLGRAPVGLLVGPLQSIAFSSASRLQDDDARTRRTYQAVLGAVSLLMFPGFVVVALEAEPVLSVIYGEKWLQASTCFAAFCVAMPLHALSAVTGPFLQARNRVGSEVQVHLVVVALMLGAFLACRDLPLELAIWLVPALYGVRYGLLLAALRRALPLRLADLGRSLAGGCLLALAGWGGSAGTSVVLAHLDVSAPLAPLMGGLLVSAGVLRLGSHRLVPRDLQQILLARCADSRLARSACHLLGLPQRSPA